MKRKNFPYRKELRRQGASKRLEKLREKFAEVLVDLSMEPHVPSNEKIREKLTDTFGLKKKGGRKPKDKKTPLKARRKKVHE